MSQTYSGTIRPTFTCIDPDCKGGIEYLVAGGGQNLRTYGYFSCRFCYKIFKIKDQLIKEYNLNVIVDDQENEKLSKGSWHFSAHKTYHKKSKGKKDFGTNYYVKDPEKEAMNFAKKCRKAWKNSKNKYKALHLKIHITHNLVYKTPKYHTHYFLRDGSNTVTDVCNRTWRFLEPNEKLPKIVNLTEKEKNKSYWYSDQTTNLKDDYWEVSVNPRQKTFVDNLLQLKKKMNNNGLPIPHSSNIFEEVKSVLLGCRTLYISHSHAKTPCCKSKFTRINFPLRTGYYNKRINFAICLTCNKLYGLKKLPDLLLQPIEIIEKRGTKFG